MNLINYLINMDLWYKSSEFGINLKQKYIVTFFGIQNSENLRILSFSKIRYIIRIHKLKNIIMSNTRMHS